MTTGTPVGSGQPVGTVSLLLSDIEGSTALLERLGAQRYGEVLERQRELLRAAFAAHGGYEVGCEGDSFFAAFTSASSAVAAAGAAQRVLTEEVWPEGAAVRVRMGVHTGEPLVAASDYVGLDVHRAARVMQAGHGGQVLVSLATKELLGDSGFVLRDLGEHRLKGLGTPMRLYQLGGEVFPPLNSLYRTNLPLVSNAFLGRERELRDVVSLLAREGVRLLTLTGPGGVGKTRLALRAVTDVAEGFVDGVWWVSLAAVRSPELLVPAIAQALEVREEPDRDPLETLVPRLAGKRLLLVLDNLEQLLPEAADVVGSLRAIEGPLLVVTSRERLRLESEHVYPVPSLDTGDAVALFAARARQLDPAFAVTPAVARLCARLDNLPLAIELAAARARLFTPEQLLERLGRRPDLLAGSRDLDPRQQTLRGTIEWSYRLLSPEEQRVHRALSVFVGGCTLDAAEQVCATDHETLQSLLDKSLLQRRDGLPTPRFSMLETVHDYALEQLERAGETEAAQDRHGRWLVALAVQAEPELRRTQAEPWLGVVTSERANFRAALERAVRRADHTTVGHLSAALGWALSVRGDVDEARKWLGLALAHAADYEPVLRARVLTAAGYEASYHVEPDLAQGYCEQALPIWQACGDALGTTACLAGLAHAAMTRGDREAARSLVHEARRLAIDNGFAQWQAIAAVFLGTLALHDGRSDEADDWLTEGLRLNREVGSPTETQTLSLLGFAAAQRDDPSAALRWFSDCLAACLDREVWALGGSMLTGMAWALACHARPNAAALLLGAAAAAREKISEWWTHVEASVHEQTLVLVRRELGDRETAELIADGRALALDEAAEYALDRGARVGTQAAPA